MDKFFYRGMKVKLVESDDTIPGKLLDFYIKYGYLIVDSVDDDLGVIFAGNGMANAGLDPKSLAPICDSNILSVLKSKEKEVVYLNNEILKIKEFINTRCEIRG